MNKNWIKTENLQPKGGFGGKGFFPNLTSGRKNIKKETLGFLFKEQSDVAGSTPARRAKNQFIGNGQKVNSKAHFSIRTRNPKGALGEKDFPQI